jgi:pimeloyl-ACP methyl ester carboxylesterase
MTYRDYLVECPDGRTLEVATLGEPSSRTVVFHHGTPGSAKLVTALAPLLEHGDYFIVTTSRAGYARSTRQAGRDVAAVVADVATALGHLGRGEYVAVGWSGGGPHALACAALDAPRCRGAVSLAGVAPMEADIDWTEGMGPENVEEFELAKQGGPEYEEKLQQMAAAFAEATPENVIELFGGLLSEVDKAALADDVERADFAEALSYGLRGQWRGFFDDDQAMLHPWGFDPAAIAVPVSVWYGDQDLMVPATHGAWLGATIPTATLHHHPEEGHISVVTNRQGELATTLEGLFGGAAA